MSVMKADRASRKGLTVIAAAGLLCTAGLAHGASISFASFNTTAPDLDITMGITVTGTAAIFEFVNASVGDSAGSSVARVYFESGLAQTGVSGGSVTGGTGTSFSNSYPGPRSVPAGKSIGWDGVFVAIGALASPKHNGIEVGDSLRFAFDYTGTEASLVNAILDPNGNARVALHVLDCVGGASCAAVSIAIIPVPAAFGLLLGALASLGFLGRRLG